MTTWLALNSIGLAAVTVVLYLLLRQMGFVLRRVGPVGARGTSAGPRIGENLLHYIPELATGRFAEKAKLIVFVSEACAICAEIKRGAEDLATVWSSDAVILLVYDCEGGDSSDTPWKEISRGLFSKRACGLRKQVGASFVPFAVIADRTGTAISKGLVNEIGHLESLLEAQKSKEFKAELPDGARISA